jgi:hypothetical protein
MRRVLERCAALDVHKRQLTACARILGQGGELEELTAEVSTMAADLLALRDWLKELGVTHVAMEATGVYWRPVWHVLEDDFELTLCNARHVKQVPGRKTDVKDAEWLCRLMEAGLLRASFVPPRPQRALRTLTRYRKTQIKARADEANRLHKALEDTGIKLDCVATDILGASGRGDIGERFPPSEERWRDADSIELLRAARQVVEAEEPEYEEHRHFHQLVIDAASNGLVSIVTRPVFNVVQRRFRREAAPKRFWTDVVEAHERILERIEEGDEEGAAVEMFSHLERLRATYERIDRASRKPER